MTVKRDRLGRPNKGWSHVNSKERVIAPEFAHTANFRVSDDDWKDLTKIAAHLGTSKCELIRTFVQWGLETEKRELGASA